MRFGPQSTHTSSDLHCGTRKKHAVITWRTGCLPNALMGAPPRQTFCAPLPIPPSSVYAGQLPSEPIRPRKTSQDHLRPTGTSWSHLARVLISTKSPQTSGSRRQRLLEKLASSIAASLSSVQSLSHIGLFATPWTAVHQASLSITNSRSLLRLMTIESVMLSNHLILCHPLLLLPSIFPSIRVFSNESVLHIRWPKYWSFSFSISLSNEYSGLISFRMDWLDLLAFQGTLKSLLQHHSSKASILQLCIPTQLNQIP